MNSHTKHNGRAGELTSRPHVPLSLGHRNAQVLVQSIGHAPAGRINDHVIGRVVPQAVHSEIAIDVLEPKVGTDALDRLFGVIQIHIRVHAANGFAFQPAI